MKTCSWCKKKREDAEFGLNRQGNVKSTCNICAEEKELLKHNKLEKKKKGEYIFDNELVEWLKKYARMPNNASTRTIRAYSIAGYQDDVLVIGREVERVCNPLFGNPML